MNNLNKREKKSGKLIAIVAAIFSATNCGGPIEEYHPQQSRPLEVLREKRYPELKESITIYDNTCSEKCPDGTRFVVFRKRIREGLIKNMPVCVDNKDAPPEDDDQKIIERMEMKCNANDMQIDVKQSKQVEQYNVSPKYICYLTCRTNEAIKFCGLYGGSIVIGPEPDNIKGCTNSSYYETYDDLDTACKNENGSVKLKTCIVKGTGKQRPIWYCPETTLNPCVFQH